MKKLLAIASVLLLVITTAYAIDLMEDNEMGQVEGQAGLSLTQYGGNITMTQRLQGLSWGDDDGCTTAGLGGVGAGYLAMRALTLAGGQGTYGMTIGLLSTIKIDVDATGLYLQLGSVGVSVEAPARLQFAVSAGVAMDTALVTNSTERVLGDLALDTLQITVATPSTLRVSPH